MSGLLYPLCCVRLAVSSVLCPDSCILCVVRLAVSSVLSGLLYPLCCVRIPVSSVFCPTGVLESLERDEAKSLIERHGGRVTTTISKKTNHIVIGREAGESKLAKVRHLSTGNFMYFKIN